MRSEVKTKGTRAHSHARAHTRALTRAYSHARTYTYPLMMLPMLFYSADFPCLSLSLLEFALSPFLSLLTCNKAKLERAKEGETEKNRKIS